VPRAISDTLKTRELVSRFLILATLAFGEQALDEGGLAVGTILENYVLDIPAGILLGVAVGFAIGWSPQAHRSGAGGDCRIDRHPLCGGAWRRGARHLRRSPRSPRAQS
jgi:hypothetical protein